MADLPLKGRLLVASPTLLDPNFFRTVIFVLEHNDDGAAGLVLNRPSETDVADVLPGWEDLTGRPAVVFAGGPVAPGSAICLALTPGDRAHEGLSRLSGPVAAVDLELEPDELSPVVTTARMFSGYAGWGAGQLESEIDEGAWFVLDSEPGDAFSSRPDALWRDVLRRQRGTLALVATFPVDVRAN